MVGAERATRFGRRAAHQGFGAGIFVGDDPATLLGADRMLPGGLRGVRFKKRSGRHQESLVGSRGDAGRRFRRRGRGSGGRGFVLGLKHVLAFSDYRI